MGTEKQAWTPEDLRRLQVPEDAQISPDGSRIAYVVSGMRPRVDDYKRTVVVAWLQGERIVKTIEVGEGTTPRWSPDGAQLAYLRDAPVSAAQQAEGGYDWAPQLHTLPVKAAPPRGRNLPLGWVLTDLPVGVNDVVWSPDSTSIAVSYLELRRDDLAAEKVIPGDDGVIPRVRTITKLDHKLDSFGEYPDHYGYTYEYTNHIGVVDVATGTLRIVASDPQRDSWSPSWSPDGSEIAFVSDRGTPDGRRRGEIWRVHADGTMARRVHPTERIGAWGRPVWSPDGERIAFMGAPWPRSDGHEDVYVMTADGGGCRAVIGDRPYTAGDQGIDDIRDEGGEMLWWTRDGGLVFAASERGSVQLKRADIMGTWCRGIRNLTEGEHRIYDASSSRRGRTVWCESNWTNPGDIWLRGRGGKAVRLTALNDQLLERRTTFTPEELQVTARDGRRIQTWMLRGGPSDAPAPTIVNVHGGPAAMYGASFFLEFQIVAGSGRNVLFCNPRGSTGYGRDFGSLVYGDPGGGDFRDIMAATDAAVASGAADPANLGICGGSYGGYMTNWAITQTNRFKAAIAGRSISNLMSFFGTSDGGLFMADDMGGKLPWKAARSYLQRSPISYVERVHTPLLLMHSDHDLRCPLEQSQQMFTALKFLGRDVELKISESASHELSRSGSPRHRIHRLQTIMSWWDRHLGRALPGAELIPRGRALSS